MRDIGPASSVGHIEAASELFDSSVDQEQAQRLLDAPDHFLLFASDEEGDPIGFVSGVEILHPDKGPEMFLNELAVAEQHRRQGIGKALVVALRDLARARGCSAMWVLTDHDNRAANRTYQSTNPSIGTSHVMYDWPLTDG